MTIEERKLSRDDWIELLFSELTVAQDDLPVAQNGSQYRGLDEKIDGTRIHQYLTNCHRS